MKQQKFAFSLEKHHQIHKMALMLNNYCLNFLHILILVIL